jgi:hypothetical protein
MELMLSRTWRARAILGLPFLLLAGCSEAPKQEAKKKEPEKPAEPVGALKAFYQMYPSARTWAADVQPLSMQSIPIAEVKASGGKFGAWQLILVSHSKGRARSYTYSVVESSGNLHQGVFAGQEQAYSAGGQQTPFLVAALKTDSEDALQTALKKSEDYVKKNPDKPINFLLEKTNRFPGPAWRVFWGDSVGTSGYSVFVDAATGQYLQTAR